MLKIFRLVPILLIFMSGCSLPLSEQSRQTSEGVKYFGQARYDTAITAFQAALKENPNDPNSLYNIAATYHQSARVDIQSGQVASAQQHYELAAQHYQLAISHNAHLADAYRGLAALYMDSQNGEAAYHLLNGWVSNNPDAIEPKLELARYYHEFAQICTAQGRLEEAQQCRDAAQTLLQQVLAADSSIHSGQGAASTVRPIVLRALGHLKEQSGDIPGAVFEYQRSLQANGQQKDLEERIAALTGL